MDLLKSLFGTSSEREVKRMMPVLEAVRKQEPRYVSMTNDQLRAQTGVFKERLSRGATLDELLPEAFAVAREAAKRVVGLRPFDVQVIGGTVLHQGSIAEMVTGEGKTLVATMPIYLNALEGRGVHLVTVNDYLARRDSEWMGPIFRYLGLTVGLIQQNMSNSERQVAYRADVTYGTNSEFGFDYLRDNSSAVRPEHCVHRELNYAIIDEVDSILVDEARTPLIISGRPEKSTDLYYKVDDAVRRLRKDLHFKLEEKHHQVLMTDEGMEYIEKLLGFEDLFTGDSLGIVHMVEQSLRAHNFFKRDDEYMVQDGQVLIVDEFTGRVLDGRRYSDGLHQAIEAKENVAVQFELQTMATITYQNLFRLYRKIAGMTGTAATEAVEFQQIYKLDVVQIPTNLPLIRDDQSDLVFATEEGKYRHVVDEIVNIHETGRPILVGTVSIEKSELVSSMLRESGIDTYEVLNAKHHEREAAIVANAGKPGAITIATNMAGRGTDIKLAEGVREAGGLAIIGTERHESRRIDNQLRGRCGRQGDPGTSRFYISLEDEVARLFGGDRVKRMLDWFGSQGMDDEPLGQRMVSRTIERAQRQVEEYNFEMRKHLKEYDDVMDKQRRVIYGMRRDVIEDRDVTEQIHQMFDNLMDDLISRYAPEDQLPDEWDLEGLVTGFQRIWGFVPDVKGELVDGEPQPLRESLTDQILKEYANRESIIADALRASYREQVGEDDSGINFTQLARKRVHEYEMMAILRAVDDKWIEHLYSMDYLRDSVRLRAYGQRDPLLEYKTEGFEMFSEMMKSIEESVVQTLFRITDPEVLKTRQLHARRGTLTAENDPFAQLSRYTYIQADKTQDRSFAVQDTSRFALAGQPSEAQAGGDQEGAARPVVKHRPIRVAPKVSPNDRCPCGSGKKYKKCCGRQLEE